MQKPQPAAAMPDLEKELGAVGEKPIPKEIPTRVPLMKERPKVLRGLGRSQLCRIILKLEEHKDIHVEVLGKQSRALVWLSVHIDSLLRDHPEVLEHPSAEALAEIAAAFLQQAKIPPASDALKAHGGGNQDGEQSAGSEEAPAKEVSGKARGKLPKAKPRKPLSKARGSKA